MRRTTPTDVHRPPCAEPKPVATSTQARGERRMPMHLNRRQTKDWVGALEAVEQIASNTDTDTESSSKLFLDTMAHFVRDEPQIVVHLLTKV
jgi:hypothetical protein